MRVVSSNFYAQTELSIGWRKIHLVPGLSKNPLSFLLNYPLTALGFSFAGVPKENCKIELVTSDNQKRLGKTLGFAALGGLTFGPAGAIVGALAGGNKTKHLVTITTPDGSALVQCDQSELKRLLAAAHSR